MLEKVSVLLMASAAVVLGISMFVVGFPRGKFTTNERCLLYTLGLLCCVVGTGVIVRNL